MNSPESGLYKWHLMKKPTIPQIHDYKYKKTAHITNDSYSRNSKE